MLRDVTMLKQWWQQRIVKRSAITDGEWQQAFARLSLLARLSDPERAELKRLAILFLHYKSLEVVDQQQLPTTMQLAIALQACLLILNLGLDWYDGWVSVIIYPGAFSKQGTEIDEYGIVHQGSKNLSGESWQRGPVILSLDDSIHHEQQQGHNVVVHEFAHKLDMLNGRANGFPPLHKGMAVDQWAKVFTHAYADFNLRLQQSDPVPINDYAATSPAEFFAVMSEYFFESPAVLKQYYSDVYDLFVSFYRQNPFG